MRNAWRVITEDLQRLVAGPTNRSVADVAAQLVINPANLKLWLRELGYAAQVPDGRWQLTAKVSEAA